MWLADKPHYNYFRDYDPRTGRYIEPDPIGLRGGLNVFSYVGNNSVNFSDPLGLGPLGDYWNFPPGAPYYNPSRWNDPDHVGTNNCYSYACNLLYPPGPPHMPQPGKEHGYILPYPNLNCADVKMGARKDGLIDVKDGECPCGYNKVELYIGSDVHPPGRGNVHMGPGYHWYRQDSNNMWSSKHGGMPVGPQIGNPSVDAQPWGYNEYCGTMCVPNK